MNDERMSWPSTERRRADRVGLEARVHLHGDDPWSGTYETADVSEAGAFVITDRPPPRGVTLSLDLDLGDGIVFSDLAALVVHVRREVTQPSARGCGLMFLRLDKDEAEGLRRAIEARQAKR